MEWIVDSGEEWIGVDSGEEWIVESGVDSG